MRLYFMCMPTNLPDTINVCLARIYNKQISVHQDYIPSASFATHIRRLIRAGARYYWIPVRNSGTQFQHQYILAASDILPQLKILTSTIISPASFHSGKNLMSLLKPHLFGPDRIFQAHLLHALAHRKQHGRRHTVQQSTSHAPEARDTTLLARLQSTSTTRPVC